ncbi:MAG: hypothetical protein QXS96_07775 [Candidatus Caldarchaeum sp.]
MATPRKDETPGTFLQASLAFRTNKHAGGVRSEAFSEEEALCGTDIVEALFF